MIGEEFLEVGIALCTGFVVTIAGVEMRKVDVLIQQFVQCVLESPSRKTNLTPPSAPFPRAPSSREVGKGK